MDRIRARSALQAAKEQPVITAIAALPVVVVFGVVWALTNFWLALVLLLVVGGVVVWKGKLLG